MTSDLPIGTEIVTTRQLLDMPMFVNDVYRRDNIPAGQVFTITSRSGALAADASRAFGTYFYKATANVNGETHNVDFSSIHFDDGSVIVYGGDPVAVDDNDDPQPVVSGGRTRKRTRRARKTRRRVKTRKYKRSA